MNMSGVGDLNRTGGVEMNHHFERSREQSSSKL
jgi:hypothetical protein